MTPVIVRQATARYLVKVWRPEQHPKDPRTGRFMRKPGGATGAPAPVAVAPRHRRGATITAGGLRKMSEDDLYQLYADLHAVDREEDLDQPAIELMNAEIDRREKTPPDDRTDQERAIDDLVGRGWEYVDAYAEVHRKDVTALREQATDAASRADRRKGEDSTRWVRRQYGEWVRLQYVAAEQGTRGHMLSEAGRRAGVDPESLFSGNAARARKYASEDLLRWWADNRRMTLTEFRASVLKRPSDLAAVARQAARGNAQNFGV